METDDFFEKQFESKMKKEYFVLFLASIHQRYNYMKLMHEMGELDRLHDDYDIMKSQLMLARTYQAQAAKFKFRDTFKLPSYVQHVNAYYELLCRAFCIEELHADLAQDLDNIEEICKVYVEKINQYEQLKKKWSKAIVKAITATLGAAIGVVTLLNESWAILESMFGMKTGTFSVPVILITAILAVPSVVGIFESLGNAQEFSKLKNEAEIEIMGIGLCESEKKRKNTKARGGK